MRSSRNLAVCCLPSGDNIVCCFDHVGLTIGEITPVSSDHIRLVPLLLRGDLSHKLISFKGDGCHFVFQPLVVAAGDEGSNQPATAHETDRHRGGPIAM